MHSVGYDHSEYLHGRGGKVWAGLIPFVRMEARDRKGTG